MTVPLRRFNEEVKHIKVIEKDSWIHITEAKKFESLLVRSCQVQLSCHSRSNRPAHPRVDSLLEIKYCSI